MFCLILIVGGLLIMMGQHDRSEALFYYFRLEDQVPETHLLRLIDKHISLSFVREKLKESYSDDCSAWAEMRKRQLLMSKMVHKCSSSWSSQTGPWRYRELNHDFVAGRHC